MTEDFHVGWVLKTDFHVGWVLKTDFHVGIEGLISKYCQSITFKDCSSASEEIAGAIASEWGRSLVVEIGL